MPWNGTWKLLQLGRSPAWTCQRCCRCDCGASHAGVENGAPLKCGAGLQSYVQPLSDAAYTTSYALSNGIPTCDTAQAAFSAAAEEPAQTAGRRPSTPTRPIPAPPAHVSSALRQKLRHVALSLAAHFRRVCRAPPRAFTLRIVRDAKSRFCLLGVSMSAQRYTSAEGETMSASRQGWSGGHEAASVTSRGNASAALDCTSTHVRSGDGSESAGGPRQTREGSLCSRSGYTDPLEVSAAPRTRRPRSALPMPAAHMPGGRSGAGRLRPRSATPSGHRERSRISGGMPAEARGKPAPSVMAVREAVASSGVPRVVDSLVHELQVVRGELVFQHELIESHSRRANKAERELQVGLCHTRACAPLGLRWGP
jgi:hypothetical protein